MAIVKILGVPALIVLSLLGLGAAILVLWLLLPELRPTIRAGIRTATAPLRRGKRA